MARLSDVIENFIKDMLVENGGEEILIQRNELADQFRCAPSQINYVLTTRFTYDKGYVIESRRGGGGYIIIKQLNYDGTEERNKIIYNSIGDSITYHNAVALIDNLYSLELISERESELMRMVVNDRTLASTKEANKLRADLLKSMLMVVVS